MAAMHDNEDLADFEENAEIAMSTAQQAVLLGTILLDITWYNCSILLDITCE